ncbi:MAG TPA: hypothetical protein VEY07_05190 [Thermoplasmata archaeon]|nr:hypothetical protein [Thermoplasmata archaeon]
MMPPAEGPEPAPVRLAEPPPDLYREIMDALEGSGSDELSRVPVPTGEPLERVSCLDGRPFLLKVTRFPRPYAAGELLERQPQYLLELGFRCALVGADSGWLLVGYDRVAAHRDRLRIYRVEFSPLETFSDLAMDRIEGIARAVREGRPEALPACPSWMYSGCPYRERCGCGVPGGPG